jgi:hypothetical protein
VESSRPGQTKPKKPREQVRALTFAPQGPPSPPHGHRTQGRRVALARSPESAHPEQPRGSCGMGSCMPQRSSWAKSPIGESRLQRSHIAQLVESTDEAAPSKPVLLVLQNRDQIVRRLHRTKLPEGFRGAAATFGRRWRRAWTHAGQPMHLRRPTLDAAANARSRPRLSKGRCATASARADSGLGRVALR